MDYWLDKLLEQTDQMKDEEVMAVKMLDLIRKMNLNLNEQLLRIDQQMNRRVTVIEVQMDSIERKLNLLDKDLREQYFSIGRRLDLLHLQLFKNDGEQNKNNDHMSVRKIQEAIENMSNEERWKLLEEMFYQYFNKDDLPKAKLKF